MQELGHSRWKEAKNRFVSKEDSPINCCFILHFYHVYLLYHVYSIMYISKTADRDPWHTFILCPQIHLPEANAHGKSGTQQSLPLRLPPLLALQFRKKHQETLRLPDNLREGTKLASSFSTVKQNYLWLCICGGEFVLVVLVFFSSSFLPSCMCLLHLHLFQKSLDSHKWIVANIAQVRIVP